MTDWHVIISPSWRRIPTPEETYPKELPEITYKPYVPAQYEREYPIYPSWMDKYKLPYVRDYEKWKRGLVPSAEIVPEKGAYTGTWRAWDQPGIGPGIDPLSSLDTFLPDTDILIVLEDWMNEEESMKIMNRVAAGNMKRILANIKPRYGQAMVDMAKALCPVDTGELRESIYYEETEDGITLLTDSAYGFRAVPAILMAYAFYEPLMLKEIDDNIRGIYA